MEEINPRLTVVDVFRYLLAYGCWVITAALSMLTLLLMRNTLNVVWPLLGGNRWLLRPIDRFGLVFMGLVWLVYVIFIEQHYRVAVTEVRVRRGRAKAGTATRAEVTPKGIMRFLRRLGLDILAQRVVPTLVAPLILLALDYLVEQAVMWIVTQ